MYVYIYTRARAHTHTHTHTHTYYRVYLRDVVLMLLLVYTLSVVYVRSFVPLPDATCNQYIYLTISLSIYHTYTCLCAYTDTCLCEDEFPGIKTLSCPT